MATCAVVESTQSLLDVPPHHGTSTASTTAAMVIVTAESVIGVWCLSRGLCITIAAAAVESHSRSNPLPTSMAVADVEVSEELYRTTVTSKAPETASTVPPICIMLRVSHPSIRHMMIANTGINGMYTAAFNAFTYQRARVNATDLTA
eukprot:CAMPEP_0182598850 /NCGR_PEP_ID=MMETSP1324-20130603/89102_1 /TAXON_ID=236786 /ORGANISM="Florenciella sp., Strain RCC1587" /LENGTH=147 /DNA_ID=CAMNT_0024816709 /DNA_START=100 /DNA_END=543 /DNA_ORIENTATION=+